MFSFLNNIPQVTKNILILNVLLYLLTYFFEGQGIDLHRSLGAYYFNSPLFQPFQVVSHFFMHGGLMHLFLNMWLFIMLGANLERLWGPKRFFTFYIASALGAFVLYNIIGVYQIEQLKTVLTANNISLDTFNNIIKNSSSQSELLSNAKNYLLSLPDISLSSLDQVQKYLSLTMTPLVGASGAVFGILAAFAILFPNTEFLLYFAIPVKAKYLVGAYFIWELYQTFNGSEGDNVAHLAHVGGAIVGAAIILFWRKNDKQNFW